MGNSWSSDAPQTVTLWVRVKDEDEEEIDIENIGYVDSRNVRSGQRVVEVISHRRTTFGELKQRLMDEFDVFPDKALREWSLAISGMDGDPRMFAFAKKTADPDENAYLYEAGIEEAAELIAYVPSQ